MNMVSVIIPVYNAQQYVKRCVDSILKQSYQAYEIILVNDCSTDNTLSVCTELSHSDERIRIINLPKNAGVSNARNQGIKAAVGEYIVFVDSDDWLHPEFLTTMMTPMLTGEYDLVCCSHINKTSDGEEPDYYEKEEKILTNREAIIGLFQNRYVQPAVWCKVFKKDILEKHHIHFDTDITISEDIKLVYEYLTYAKQCFVVNQSLYWYVIDNINSAMNASKKNERFQIKWLSAWTAYERMSRYTEEHFMHDVEVKRAFLAAKTCTARMKLHLMQEFSYQNPDYYRSMLQVIRENIWDYLKYDYSDKKRKMMMLLCSLSPRLEYKVWRCMAKS